MGKENKKPDKDDKDIDISRAMFEIDTRKTKKGGTRSCFKYMLWIADEVEAGADKDKLWNDYQRAMAGEIPCPLNDTCEKALQAKKDGHRFISDKPLQFTW